MLTNIKTLLFFADWILTPERALYTTEIAESTEIKPLTIDGWGTGWVTPPFFKFLKLRPSVV